MGDTPEFPNDGSLLSDLFIDTDTAAYNGAKNFLDMIGLPNPRFGEFQRAHNVHRIYTPHGLVISFLHRHVSPLPWLSQKLFGRGQENISPVFEGRKIVHDKILQPLLQIDLSPRSCVEIVPGCPRLPLTLPELEQLSGEFARDKISFYSKRFEFIGKITDTDGNPALMVTNRRAFKPLKGYEPGTAPIQDRIYGGLKKKFADAYQSGSSEKFRSLLSECRENAGLDDRDSSKLLYTHWNAVKRDLSERQLEIHQAAARFERRLEMA